LLENKGNSKYRKRTDHGRQKLAKANNKKTIAT
jgi:hypothetical protein